MAEVPDPSVQRRRLRTELRKARDAAGLKQADVAKAMDWSPSKLIRIESGQVSISTNDLRVLLEHYKVKDRGRINALVEMAKSARAGSVYDRYHDVIKGGFKDYLAYEGSAAVIRQYDPNLISGLVQIEEYATTILQHAYGYDEIAAARAWEVREQRQRVHDRENPPEMRLIIDESALRRQVGRKESIMRAQVEQLLEFAARDHVAILVLPFSAGAHPGLTGNFFLLEFAEPDIDDLVGLEAVNDFEIRFDTETLGTYVDRFQRLEELSLSAEDSVAFLEKLLGEQKPAEVVPAAVAG